MSSLTIARSRRASESQVVHTVYPHEGRTMIDRYGDSLHCAECGAEVVPGTPGRARLDMDFACGLIDADEYLERLDALYGHP